MTQNHYLDSSHKTELTIIDKPTLMSATVSRKNGTSFAVELEFTLFVKGINSNDDADKVHNKLVAACPNGWEIE